jgi:hypothetical protein
MAVYAITGKLGSGKGKAAIQRLRTYIQEGKRVATNCDVFMEYLGDEICKASVLRVPDKPCAADLYLIGSGNRFVEFDININYQGDKWQVIAPVNSPRMLPGFDECHNGALVLDECGSWLNTRNFQDKGRAELLEWAIHARKYGWDIFFITQNISQIDKQIRESLFEYVVRLNRLDRMRVPFLSSAVKLVTAGALSGNMPRVHIAVVRIGSAPDALVADRWIFQGDDLHNAYNTTQVFTENYPHGVHSLLSPWHLSAKFGVLPGFVGPLRPGVVDHVCLKNRALPPKSLSKHMSKFLVIALCLGVLLGGVAVHLFGGRVDAGSAPVAAIIADKLPDGVVARGVMQHDGIVSVMLSDGRVVVPMAYIKDASGVWSATLTPGVVVHGGTQ